MKVRAIREGQLPDTSWVKVGDVFDIEDHLISTRWMEPENGGPFPAHVLEAIKARKAASAPAVSAFDGLAVAKTEAQIRAEIEAEYRMRAAIEAEVRAKVSNELRASIEAEVRAQIAAEAAGEAPAEAPKPRGRPKSTPVEEPVPDINDA